MSRVQRLEQAAEFAAEQEKKAAKALGQAASRLEEANARLEALCRFRGEYLSYLKPGGVAVSARQLLELHTFLSRLGRAIEEQEAVLQKLRQEHAALQSAWQRAYCRRRGIEKIRENWLRREQLASERKLQRELDDRAAARCRTSRGRG